MKNIGTDTGARALDCNTVRTSHKDSPIEVLLLTRKQAAAALNVSVRYLDGLIKNDELSVVRFGRIVRVRALGVREFVSRGLKLAAK